MINNHLQDARLNAGPCIELLSLHQGMLQSFTTDKAAPGTNQPVITELSCVKCVDQISSKLLDYSLRAEPLGRGKDRPAILYILRNSGDQLINVMTITLRDALITEMQMQAHADDTPTEQFKLNFTEVLWSYSAQLSTSHVADKIATGWNKERRHTITAFTD